MVAPRMFGGASVIVLWAACAVLCCWPPVASQDPQLERVVTFRDIYLVHRDEAYEPKSGGESRVGSEDVEMGALDMTTVKTKAPNKPTNMVLFYTWLILVVLIAVVTISTCKTRIVGLFNRAKMSTGHQRPPEEGKRLLEHEYV